MEFDKADVIIRRDFSAQKDDIFLNGKQVSRHELVTLLDAAGFSRSNPYYFIHQHEVAELVRMNNAQRLSTLKECAGTRVYDARRSEALRSLDDTRAKRKVIDFLLEMIEMRIDEIKQDQHVLDECLRLETEKLRLMNKEFSCIEDKLTTLMLQKEECRKKETQFNKDINSITEKMQTLQYSNAKDVEAYNMLSDTLKCTTEQLTKAKRDSARLSFALRHHKKKHTTLKATFQSCNEAVDRYLKEKESHQRAMDAMKQEETKKRKQLYALDENLHNISISTKDQENSHAKSRTETTLMNVSHCEHELTTLESLLQHAYAEEASVTKTLNDKETRFQEVQQSLQGSPLVSTESLSTQDSPEYNDANVQSCVTPSDEDLLKKLHGLQEALSQMESSLSLRQRRTYSHVTYDSCQTLVEEVYRTMHLAQLNGYLASVKFATHHNWIETQHFLGPLFGSIQVDPMYHTAVEAAGGFQLLNLLLADEDHALQLATHLRETNAGSAVLVPLRKLGKFRSVTENTITALGLPDSTGVVPLVSVIHSPPNVRPAVLQVFSKFLLLNRKDSNTARTIASKGFDCVTLDGDLISRKGTLTGGSRTSTSRLALQTTINELRRTMEQTQQDINQVLSHLQQLGEAHVSEVAEAHRVSQKKSLAQQKACEAKQTLVQLGSEIEVYRKQREELQASIVQLESQKTCVETQLRLYKKSASGVEDLSTCETETDQSSILYRERLVAEREILNTELEALGSSLEDASHRLHLYITSPLTREAEHLKKILTELEDNSVEMTVAQEHYDLLQKQVVQLELKVSNLEIRQREQTSQLKAFENEMHTLQVDLDNLQLQHSEIQSEMERLQDKINALQYVHR